MKEDYQKALKKVTSFFPSNLVPFNRQNYQKQKRPRNMSKFDDVIQSGFWVNSKNYICKFMLANLWHHKIIPLIIPRALPLLWPKNDDFVIFMQFLGILPKPIELISENLKFDRKNCDLYQPLTIILMWGTYKFGNSTADCFLCRLFSA